MLEIEFKSAAVATPLSEAAKSARVEDTVAKLAAVAALAVAAAELPLAIAEPLACTAKLSQQL